MTSQIPVGFERIGYGGYNLDIVALIIPISGTLVHYDILDVTDVHRCSLS